MAAIEAFVPTACERPVRVAARFEHAHLIRAARRTSKLRPLFPGSRIAAIRSA